MDEPVLYMLVPAAEIPEDAWRTRQGWTTAFVGKQSTKFISLLAPEQVAGAAERLFAGRDDIMLLSFVVETMREEADLQIKFEAAESEAGGAGAFPHAYGGPIPYACLYATPALLKLADGKHVLPPLGMVATAAAAAAQEASILIDEEDYDNDNSEAFDQHRFDLDDSDNELLDG